MHFLGASAHERVLPACYSLATCWRLVGYLLDCRCGSRPRQTLAGSSEMDLSRLGAHMEPTWLSLRLTSGHFSNKFPFSSLKMKKVLPALCGKHIFASHPTAFGVQNRHFQPSKRVHTSYLSHLFPLPSLLGPLVSSFFGTMSPSRIALSLVTCAHLSSVGALGPELGPTKGPMAPTWSRSRAIWSRHEDDHAPLLEEISPFMR